MTGTFSSRARPFNPREISEISWTRLSVRRPLHQLQVVDDEHVEAVLGLETAGFGADVHDADASGVVDEDVRFGEAAERARDPVPLVCR